MTVIAEMLGLPAADHDTFRGWADRLFSMQVDDPTDPELGARVEAAMADIRAYLVARVQERRAAVADGTAGDDLITALVTAEVVTDGTPVLLDDEEAANFSLLLLLAGHITTTVLLGNALRTFHDHPLRRRPRHLDRARGGPRPRSRPRSRRCCGCAARSPRPAA